MSENQYESGNFIRDIIKKNIEDNSNLEIITRFPPEPNGYLHIGHAKSIWINFGLARQFGGKCNLRFDDTNPVKEDVEYVRAIQEDIKWLGFDWEGEALYGSDYFEKMYAWAVELVKAGKAYVCDLNADQVKDFRGTLTEPGKNSPYRDRPVDENLTLFSKMRAGEFEDGSRTLRAKIDMSSGNLNMRDPVMYRILKATHHRTGDEWCIYPTYDWAHGLEDSIEGITHSLCSLEFEDHRPLYDWFLENLGILHPRQIEFAKLNLTHTVLSKRRLIMLANDERISGWDDPRMPTLSGLRRRGYTPKSILGFCKRLGVAKVPGTASPDLLEHCLREELNLSAQRTMAVLRPLKVVIENYPEGKEEWFDAENNPEDPESGTRKIPFSREIYIEHDDFMLDPPKKYFRLSPGKEVRLKHAYYITCTGYDTDDAGNITLVRCTYDPESRGGWTNDGRKVRGTSHWVSAAHCASAQVRLYNRLFETERPGEETGNFMDDISENSLEVLPDAKIEPTLASPEIGSRYQFLRNGYFFTDSDTTPGKPVFNLTVSLKDTWARVKRNQ